MKGYFSAQDRGWNNKTYQKATYDTAHSGSYSPITNKVLIRCMIVSKVEFFPCKKTRCAHLWQTLILVRHIRHMEDTSTKQTIFLDIFSTWKYFNPPRKTQKLKNANVEPITSIHSIHSFQQELLQGIGHLNSCASAF